MKRKPKYIPKKKRELPQRLPLYEYNLAEHIVSFSDDELAHLKKLGFTVEHIPQKGYKITKEKG